MKLIDRYVLKQFLYALLFVLSALTVVITLIDFTEKNGHFIQHKLAYGEVLRYYCYGYIPFMVNFITPIGVFVTTVFVTSRLAQRSEIIAMLGSGISFKRFLLPYLVGASLVTGCSFVLTGWVMAKANIRRVAFETEYINGFFNNRSQHLHIKIAPNRYFYVARYSTQHHVGTHVTIETIENNELLEKLSARRIYWLPTAQTWQLQDWTRRTLDGQEERIQRGSTLDISLDIQPDDFSINPRLHETLTLPELNAHIQVLKSRGADNVHIFLIEKYVRCMSPFDYRLAAT